MSRSRPMLTGLLVVCLPWISQVSAEVITWDGDTSSDFEASDNWVTGSAPANNITADTATFGVVGTSAQPALTTSRSLLGVNFTGAGWTLSGPYTLTLGTGGVDSAGSGTNSLSVNGLCLGADSTWTIGDKNRLLVSSTISGSGKLTKNGAGELVLAGPNSYYTGDTTIASGTLTLGADNVLSASSRLTLSSSSSTLKLNGHNATLYGINGTTAVANSTIINGASTPVTLTLTADSGSVSYYRGTIGTSNGSDADNAIAVVVPNVGSNLTVRWFVTPNYYTGGTTVKGNSLASQAQGALGTGPVTITSGGRLVAIGAGSLDSSAADNPALNVTLEDGTLDFRNTSPSAIDKVGGNLTVVGNATFQTSGTGPGVNAGPLTIGSYELTFSSSTAVPTLVLGPTTLTGASTFNIANSTGTLRLGAVSGDYGFTKKGSGTLELSAPSTYTGATTIESGTLMLGANNALSAASALSISSGATLKMNGYNATAHNLSGAGKIVNGASTTPVTLTLSSAAGNYNSHFSGSLGQSGGTPEENAIAVVFQNATTAAGAIWLDTANYYTGGTTVKSDVLVATTRGALGTGPVTINTGGRLLANGNGTLNSSAPDAPALNITLNAGGTLDFRRKANETVCNVGGNLSVAGNATLQVSASSPTASNPESVTGGPMSIGSHTLTVKAGNNMDNVPAYSLTLGATTLTGNARFAVNNTATSTGSLRLNDVAGNYGLTKSGNGSLVLLGSSTYTGDTTVSAGLLAIDGNKTGSGSVTVAAGATLTGSGDVAGNVTIGTGAFLTGTGAYRGLVTIEGTHAPGNSPGTQTFSSGLTYAATSLLQWDLTANTTDEPGILYDQILVTGGDLTIDPDATLSLVFGDDVEFTNTFWDTTHTWTLIDYSGTGTSTGCFSNVSSAASYAGRGTFTANNTGGDIQLTWTPKTAAVPEPSALTLIAVFGLALVGLGGRQPSRLFRRR